MHRGAFLFPLILGWLIITRADISKEDFQKWVDDSTLILRGTIVVVDSNVSSITVRDNPIDHKWS